jgi:hypothetical protein
LHGSVQMDSVALFSWIGWLRHHGIFKHGMLFYKCLKDKAMNIEINQYSYLSPKNNNKQKKPF